MVEFTKNDPELFTTFVYIVQIEVDAFIRTFNLYLPEKIGLTEEHQIVSPASLFVCFPDIAEKGFFIFVYCLRLSLFNSFIY